MSDLSVDEAHQFIKNLRSENGGVSAEGRDGASKELLAALQSVRRQLANTIKM